MKRLTQGVISVLLTLGCVQMAHAVFSAFPAPTPTPIPEPSSISLLLIGGVGVAVAAYVNKRNRRK